MFDFTTENVLNDLSRVSVVTPAQDKAIPSGGSGLKIKGVNTFIVSHMTPVWKQAGTAATKEVATLTIPNITTAGTYRFHLEVGLSGSTSADFSRFDDSYGKPAYIEFNLTTSDTATTIAAKLKKYFNKYDGPASFKGVDVTGSGTTLTITANSEYLRLKSLVLDRYDATLFEYVPYASIFAVTTPGNAGFGTAWNLLWNLRLPTQAATYLTAEDLDERPIVGTLYNQYTFRYTANRNIHGTGVLGEVASSVTTHVLFVLSTLASTFEGLLTSAGATVVPAVDAITPVDDLQGSDVVIP
jgi:hypothetical protein